MDNEKKSSIYMYVKKKNNNKESIKKIFDRWYPSQLDFLFFKSLIARKLSSL